VVVFGFLDERQHVVDPSGPMMNGCYEFRLIGRFDAAAVAG